METIYFLAFIGVCAVAVFVATRRSKTPKNLAARRKEKRPITTEKLYHPADNRLAHHEQIWAERQMRTSKTFEEKPSFIPKSVSGGDPGYDGYSRRDRHHLVPKGHVKTDHKTGHWMSATKLESDDYPSKTKTA